MNSKLENACALAVIIGRAGSKGLPGKNARSIAGRPMVFHTIQDAMQSASVGRIIVSTDGDAIAAAAESMAVEVIRRPASLASDTATVDSAVRHAVQSGSAMESIVVILYANVPVRPDDLIDRAVATLIETGADSVQSYSDVGKNHPHWMVQLDDERRVTPNVRNTIYRRQDLTKLFMPNGGVIAVRRDTLFTVIEGQPHAFLGNDRRGIISPEGSVVDVDNQTDYLVAEARLLATRSATDNCPVVR